MNQDQPNTYSIRAVQRVCDVLDLIREHPDGFTLTQVAQRADFPKSSAFRYLATLEARRYVRRDSKSGLYRIGPGFLLLQGQQDKVLRDFAAPYLVRLRDKYDETANLGILEGHRVSYLEIVESRRSVRLAARPGDRDPIHSTALGKAIASTLPVERVREILSSEGMPRRTPRTITSVKRYLSELDQVRADGYAADELENEDEGRCVAVPLLGLDLPAAISLSAPASRLDAKRLPGAGAELAAVAAEIVAAFRGPT